MKKLIIIFLMFISLGLSSFKSNDTLCGVNYNGVTSQGCNISVQGTIECGTQYPWSGFTGTVSYSGPPPCDNISVPFSSVRPHDDGTFSLPTGYSIGFYPVDERGNYTDNICNAKNLVFFGTSVSQVAGLNEISKAYLKKIQTSMGC
jgi:hypothetical protein